MQSFECKLDARNNNIGSVHVWIYYYFINLFRIVWDNNYGQYSYLFYLYNSFNFNEYFSTISAKGNRNFDNFIF